MKEDYLKQSSLLYVEDEESIRTFLERKLRRKVKNLYVAKDGQEGFEKYCQFKPDIVLTDITMPKLSGISMSKKIKETNKNAPIIIMSAHSDTNYLIQAIELGINAYLLKPIDKIKLLETLEQNAKNIFIEKELEEQKKQVLHQSRFALLGEMLSMIAHQWRQPLNRIALNVFTLKVKLESPHLDLSSKEVQESLPKEVCEQIDKIEEHVQHLSSVIDDFSSFYKSSSQIERLCINSIVKKSIEIFNHSTTLENIVIDEKYDSTKKTKLYEDEFLQICINLLNNSYEKFKENKTENPQINIETTDTQDGVILTISDNAGGVDEELIDKIFDPYFSTKKEKNGTGLGLYMSKLIINEHLHGNISVKNENLGLKFTIEIKDI